jgi:serine phosphatase RsbU (regulator of sigma subunit)
MTNAGHPPPVVLRYDGTVEQLTTTEGAPLGIEAGEREVITFTFRSRDLLLAFTDGLIERRDEDIDAGQRRVIDETARLMGGGLAQRLDLLVSRARDHTRSDDVAAVAVRRV